MSTAAYPFDLPCPAAIVTTPAERRLSSDIPGNKQFRGLQRDYLATERIDWPPFNQAQAETFKLWWRDALLEGGAWFYADWPSPQGGIVVRRFMAPPQWQYIHGGIDKRMWRVSADCEVRGRGALPVVSNVLLRLPFDAPAPIDVSPLRRAWNYYRIPDGFGGFYVDEEYTQLQSTVARFGSALQVAYARSGSFSNKIPVYAATPQMNGDFTIQLWLLADSYPRCVPIASNGIQGEFVYNLSGIGAWDITLGISTQSFRWWDEDDSVGHDGFVAIAAPLPVSEWWHLAVVRKSGVINVYLNGASTTTPASYSKPIGGAYPVSVGGTRRNSPIGHDFFASGGGAGAAGYIDDVMISAVAEYDGDFTPPASPLRTR